MVLSDRSIKEQIAKGRIVITPLNPSYIQPASVDVCLGEKLRVFRPWHFPHQIDLRQPLDGLTELVKVEEGHYFSLQPGQFVLGSTVEYIELPDDIMGRLEGKSSLGRIGLLVHSTAGYIDPGWKGHLTLELFSVSALPILLYPGMKISQISFHGLTTPADRPYGTPGLGSKYQGQEGPVPTRYHQEFVQPALLSMPSVAVERKDARSGADFSELRHWLKYSQYKGSVKRFSEALGVPVKTVEGWLYGGRKPGPDNRRKLFSLTRLPQFMDGSEVETRRLLPEEHS